MRPAAASSSRSPARGRRCATAQALGHLHCRYGGGERTARRRVYAAKPIIPAGLTALNLNYDSFYPVRRVSATWSSSVRNEPASIPREAGARASTLPSSPTPPRAGPLLPLGSLCLCPRRRPAFSINMGTDYMGKEETPAPTSATSTTPRTTTSRATNTTKNGTWPVPEQMARFGWTIGLYHRQFRGRAYVAGRR
jgi:hypothetical protein